VQYFPRWRVELVRVFRAAVITEMDRMFLGVPEGRPTIAQEFTPGFASEKKN
jgi:hypothetical protein